MATDGAPTQCLSRDRVWSRSGVLHNQVGGDLLNVAAVVIEHEAVRGMEELPLAF